MGFNKRFQRIENETSEINISPLLDMVFILLIFFVVTTTFTRETGVEVQKPKASTASAIKDKTIKIAITREGTIHIFEKQVDLQNLEAILKRERDKEPGLKVVVIADNDSVTGKLVTVIDKCTAAGFENVSIAAISE